MSARSPAASKKKGSKKKKDGPKKKLNVPKSPRPGKKSPKVLPKSPRTVGNKNDKKLGKKGTNKGDKKTKKDKTKPAKSGKGKNKVPKSPKPSKGGKTVGKASTKKDGKKGKNKGKPKKEKSKKEEDSDEAAYPEDNSDVPPAAMAILDAFLAKEEKEELDRMEIAKRQADIIQAATTTTTATTTALATTSVTEVSATEASTQDEKKEDLILHTNPICPFAQRAWIAAIDKNVDFKINIIPLSGELKQAGDDFNGWKSKSKSWADVDIDLAGMQKIKDDYKKDINHGGTVPTLVHGEKIVLESDFCAYYLDEAWPEQGIKLCPDDSHKLYKVRYMLEQFNIGYLYGALKNQDPAKDEEFKTKIYKMHEKFVEIADEKGPFFLGEKWSIAEVLVAPFYDRFSRLLIHYRAFDYIPSQELDQTYPWAAWLRNWAKSVDAHPSFITTSQGAKYIEYYSGYAGDRQTPKSTGSEEEE